MLRRALPYVAAVIVWVAAMLPIRSPMVVGLLALTCVLLVRRPVALLVGLAVSASVFAGNARAGLAPPRLGPWSGEVTMVADPTERGAGTAVDVSSRIGRFEAVGWGPSGRVLLEHQAGDRLRVEGRLIELPPGTWSTARHLRARLVVSTVHIGRSTVWWMRPSNIIRSSVLAGAHSLPPEQRPLYAGFVLGDDRGRSEEVTREFEESGLSHLLVVSGENVVFVLLVLSPLLDRLGRRGRVVATIVALVLFAAATRFEPSVLRATAMAGVATLTVASGRASSGRRSLAVTVVALVLLDPLLVHSLGFSLSVAAAAGIVVLGPIMERRLRGPRRFRALLAVTLAAQLAVAPLIVPVFGPLPLVAVPANLLAEPIAGVVMMWGCTGGIVAGLIGGTAGAVVQFPARLGLAWVMGVAEVASALPRVDVGLAPIAAIVVFAGALGLVRHRRPSRPRASTRSVEVGR